MHFEQSFISCGIDEISDLPSNNIKNKIHALYAVYETLPALFIFSDIEKGSGENLFNYIKKFKLGRVSKSRRYKNPNTGNMIILYYWHPNKVALARHLGRK